MWRRQERCENTLFIEWTWNQKRNFEPEPLFFVVVVVEISWLGAAERQRLLSLYLMSFKAWL